MVRRSAAKAGDRLVVTGTIGDAALGLRLRRDPHWRKALVGSIAARDHLLSRYRLPQPRSALAAALRAHASAAMDVSDGLAGDLAKLCRASGVTAEIEIAKVPLSAPAQAALAAEPALIEPILSGGDDYEVVAAIPAGQARVVPPCRRRGRCFGERDRPGGGRGGAPLAFSTAMDAAIALGRLSFSHF